MHCSTRPAKRLARENVRSEAIPYLQDDIVVDILSRLPADDVLRCRCVCKGWRDLTTNQEFVDMHLKQQVSTAPPILVNIPWDHGGSDHCFIENWWDPDVMRRKRGVFAYSPDHDILFSQGGLIVLMEYKDPLQVTILNPINGESVTIKFLGDLAYTGKLDYIYGVFFHPLLKEYCMLWGPFTKLVKFKLLVVGSTPYWRDIGNPLGDKSKAFGAPQPVLLNDCLYWMSEPEGNKSHYDIVEFDLRSEKFVVIPSPITKMSMSLLDTLSVLIIDGLLSVAVLDTSVEKKLLTIWTLKDRPRKVWTTSSHSISSKEYYPCDTLKLIALVKGDLCFFTDWKVYVYNHKSETMKPFQPLNLGYRATVISQVMSLASLKTCKSQIEASETTEETNEGQIQIIWEQFGKAQAQETSDQ